MTMGPGMSMGQQLEEAPELFVTPLHILGVAGGAPLYQLKLHFYQS